MLAGIGLATGRCHPPKQQAVQDQLLRGHAFIATGKRSRLGTFLLVAAAFLLLFVTSALLFDRSDEIGRIPAGDRRIKQDRDSLASSAGSDRDFSEADRGYRPDLSGKELFIAPDEGRPAEEWRPKFDPMPEPGWLVWGYVRDEDDQPVKDAQVTVTVLLCERDCEVVPGIVVGKPLVLFSGTAKVEADGLYRIGIPLITAGNGFCEKSPVHTKIAAYASAPTLAQTDDEYCYVELHLLKKHEVVRMDIELESGKYLRGRVTTENGLVVDEAYVSLWLVDSDGSIRNAGAITNPNGEYVIDIHSLDDGTYNLAACKTSAGLSDPCLMEIGENSSEAAPDLVLHPRARLNGVTVYPDGSPAAEVSLSTSLWGEEPLDSHSWLPTLMRDGRLQGLDFDVTISDRRGRFCFEGLIPGEYGVSICNDLEIPDEKRIFRCRSDANLYRIEVDAHRLHITVKDEQGNKIFSPDVKVEWEGGDSYADIVGGEGWAQVVPGNITVRGSSENTTTGKNDLVGDVSLFIPEGRYQSELQLVLRSRKPGRLKLRFLLEDGSPFPDLGVLDVRLWGGPDYFKGWRTKNCPEDPEDIVIELTPGTYQGRVYIKSPDQYDIGERALPWTMFCTEVIEPLIIEQGRLTARDVVLRKGGWFQITLHGEKAGADFFFGHRDFGNPANQLIWITPQTASEQDDWDQINGVTDPGGAFRDFRHGSTLEGEVPYLIKRNLHPGRYRIRVEPRGYAPAIAEVEITPGGLTGIDIDLRRAGSGSGSR